MTVRKMDETLSDYYCITTPIYYVNDIPHIGHAYTTVICDVFSRFLKLSGHKVRFLTGTDEHGQKVENAARATQVTTVEFCNKYSKIFKQLADKLLANYDDFIRTTEIRHQTSVLALWKLLQENNQVYLGSYSGWYSIRDEAFYQEKELVDGKAPTGASVEWIEEPSYFFKLSQWQEQLLNFYENNPDFITPISRYNEVISFVKSGLKDLSISRTNFQWGISLPENPTHVIYVWIDALANYLTGLDFPNLGLQKNWDTSNVVHVIGKDILRFHAVYWPAILMAAKLPVPQQIIAHGWWMNEGQKMSKSIGNVVDPFPLIEEFGIDQMRYFLMREMPLGNDGNFSKSSLINRVNAELTNNIGNLVQRTIAFLHRECGGVVPHVELSLLAGEHSLPNYEYIYQEVMNDLARRRFDSVILLIIELSSTANEYINQNAPWKLAKTNRELMSIVLYKLLEYIRCIGLLLQPVTPLAADAILSQVLVANCNRNLDDLKNSKILMGFSLPKPNPIFPKLKLNGNQVGGAQNEFKE